MNRTWKLGKQQSARRIFGGRLLLVESHERDCPCSYCDKKGGALVSFWMPQDRVWNAWRVLHFGRLYIRWTGGPRP